MIEKKRTDFLPVILGGEMSTYPLGRQFFEAYGVQSVCIAPDAIKLIACSRFFTVEHVDDMHLDTIRACVRAIAEKNRDKTLILLGNWDAAIEMIEKMAPDLPENVLCPTPPKDVRMRAADKTEFAEMCAQYGLETPKTEIVSLAGETLPPSTEIPFPLIAKPAVSGEYSHLYPLGFQKVYFFQSQSELDALWTRLRDAGFRGEFMVQELIGGDDTYMESITMYVDRSGAPTLMSSAQVLLQDHNPAFFGNPVSMITRPLPDLWEKVGRMLSEIGWRGFANIDLKVDPVSGRSVFMDFNPRIGANSYYTCAAGINPMRKLVEDLLDGTSEPQRIQKTVLYTRVPVRLTRKYLRDEALRSEYDSIVNEGRVANPLRCKEDSFKSRFYGMLMEKNFIRKFRLFYPEATDTSF